jgi:hypothetical protein
MLNDLLTGLTEENEKQQLGLKKISEDLIKQEEISDELNEKKFEIQTEAALLKARFNCIKKEVELKKNYLTEIMSKLEVKPEDEKLSCIDELVDRICELSIDINTKLSYGLLETLTKNCFKFN